MRTVRILIVMLVCILGILTFAGFAAQQDASATAVVIDVRTEIEWNAGHLEGALLIPYDQIETGIARVGISRTSKIYLYCRTGRRTGIAFDVLTKAGYEDLVNLGTMENASKTLNRAIVK